MADRARKEKELQLLQLQRAVKERQKEVARPFEETPEAQRRFRLREAITEVAPEVVGGTIGTALGGLPGGVLGAGAGEAGQQLFRRAIGAGEVPETGLEAAGRIATAGAEEFIGQKVAGAVGRVLNRILPTPEGFVKSVSPEAEEALEILRPKGATLTLGQATENRAFDLMENVAENAFFGGGSIISTKITAQKAAQGMLENFVNDFGTTVDRAAIKGLVQDTIENKQGLFRKVTNALYGKIDNAITDNIGPIVEKFSREGSVVAGFDDLGRPLVTLTKPDGTIKLVDRIDITSLKEMAESIKGKLPSGLGRTLNYIKNQPDNVTFLEANELRSNLFEIADAPITRQFGKKIGAAHTRLASNIDDLMRKKGEELPEEVLKNWETARAFVREGSPKFNNALVRKIANKDAEGLIDTLIKTKEPTDIRAVREVIDDPEIWANVQGRFLRRIIEPKVGKEFTSGQDILRNIAKLDELGDDVLKEFFPDKAQIRQLEKIGRVLTKTQEISPIGTGRVAVQLTQAGAGIGVATGDAKRRLTSALILMVPAAFAKFLSNPKITNFMITKGKGIKTAKAATQYLSKLSIFLAKEGIEHELGEPEQTVEEFVTELEAD